MSNTVTLTFDDDVTSAGGMDLAKAERVVAAFRRQSFNNWIGVGGGGTDRLADDWPGHQHLFYGVLPVEVEAAIRLIVAGA